MTVRIKDGEITNVDDERTGCGCLLLILGGVVGLVIFLALCVKLFMWIVS
jgi:hypothetical protein